MVEQDKHDDGRISPLIEKQWEPYDLRDAAEFYRGMAPTAEDVQELRRALWGARR